MARILSEIFVQGGGRIPKKFKKYKIFVGSYTLCGKKVCKFYCNDTIIFGIKTPLFSWSNLQ